MSTSPDSSPRLAVLATWPFVLFNRKLRHLRMPEPPPLEPRHGGRWMGWRLRLIVGAALLGCLGIFFLPSLIGSTAHINAEWNVDAAGRVRLKSSTYPQLARFDGLALLQLEAGGIELPVDALLLEKSARWLSSDEDRLDYHKERRILGRILAQDEVTLVFEKGLRVSVSPSRLKASDLTIGFWVFSAMGLLLYLLAMVVWLSHPGMGNLLYAIMALSQAGNLVFIAIESTVGLGLLGRFDVWDAHMRMGFDLAASAAVVHAVTMRPIRIPHARLIASATWLFAAMLFATELFGLMSSGWWWTQAACGAMGLVAMMLLSWSYKLEPHPMAIVLRRLLILAAGTWSLLTIAVAVTDDALGLQHGISSVGSMVWYGFLASLLALVPFVGQPKPVMREFSLLAAVSTVATSLDLLFVALFSLSQYASLTLSLFVSVGVYVGVRQWLLSQFRSRSLVTTERMFERLYRTARAVEANPEQSVILLSQLLREIFEPLEVLLYEAPCNASRVERDGSTLRVAVPALGDDQSSSGTSIVIRFADRGRRLFTTEDASLADGVVDQLRRAVAFDRAVEHGRAEERARLAQDLHDDIGARLLTMMYKASSPEMEDYVRHTLQDLKTLTRGLAAPNHPLSHAEAEWKSDLNQRLQAARISLDWTVASELDILFSVVQWSAITRILRELVSNIISHAQATSVRIHLDFTADRLDLCVEDNGLGRAPKDWSHGLGLGGVRKRARQLAGDVEWTEREGGGIRCQVNIRQTWQVR